MLMALLVVITALLARSESTCYDATSALQTRAEKSPCSKKPNILLFLPDQLRWDWAGFNGPAVRMPNLAKLAKRGTRFTKAYTASALCETARATLASGQWYDNNPTQDMGTDFPTDSHDTYYKLLRDAGYHTIMAGKDHLTGGTGVYLNGSFNTEPLGLSDYTRTTDKYENSAEDAPHEPYGAWVQGHGEIETRLGKMDAYEALKKCYGELGTKNICCKAMSTIEPPGLPWELLMSQRGEFCPMADLLDDELTPDTWVKKIAKDLLDRAPAEKPWFMQVGFLGPHPPFINTEKMKKSTDGIKYPPAFNCSQMTLQRQQKQRQQYAGLIEHIDTMVGEVLDYVEERGELNNTIVVFTSDHGEMLGDFDILGKVVPWDGASRVPLIISGPGLQKNVVVDSPVSTLDIVGTFLDAAGTSPNQAQQQMDTKSFLPFLKGLQPLPRDTVKSGLTYIAINKDYRVVVKEVNKTSTLKLVCCAQRCPWGIFNTFQGRINTDPEAFVFAVGDTPAEEGPELLSTLEGDALEEVKQQALDLVPDLEQGNYESYLYKCAKFIEEEQWRDSRNSSHSLQGQALVPGLVGHHNVSIGLAPGRQ